MPLRYERIGPRIDLNLYSTHRLRYMTLEELNIRFGLQNHISIEEKPENFPIVTLHSPTATATIAAHGGHVLSYAPNNVEPVLWLSALSHYRKGKAIRGGIPVIWPWFGPHLSDSSKPSHGFARTRFWNLHSTRLIDDAYPQVRFQLEDSEITRSLWPHTFSLELIVTLTESLKVDLIIRNTDKEPFTCTCALHSYFNVSDISKISIQGLENASYIDQLVDGPLKTQAGAITFNQETDNIYVDTDATCVITDPGYNRTITVEKSGSQSTVIWNPWIDKSARMSDFGDSEYTGMLCIEAANAAHNAITLSPSEQHILSTTIHSASI